jgi:glycosyltransferase involved in cell wall biosynthesis
MPSGQAVHYCLGFEAGLEHNRDQHQEILDAYSTPLPGFAVSPHLAELLRVRFDRPARVVPPAVEGWCVPRRRIGPRRSPRILVPSPFENYVKGVPTAIAAVRRLREAGLRAVLVRVSQWPLSDDERRLLIPDEFHANLMPSDVARLMAGCDLVMAPSSHQEGFGLWVLEAMACGVPVVASRIAAHEGFAADAAELVTTGDVDGFAAAAGGVLGSGGRWRRMRRAGLRVAHQFNESSVARKLDAAMRWVGDGRWREEV